MSYFDYYSRFNDFSEKRKKNTFFDFKNFYTQYLPQNKKIKVLDIGCGIGTLVSWLMSEGYHDSQGIDINPSQIEFGTKEIKNIQHVENPLIWLAQNKPFDVIFMTDVLEHIPETLACEYVKTIKGSLNRNGILIATVPNANSTFGNRFRYIDPTHLRSYTEHSLWHLMSEGGFNEINIVPQEHWKFRGFSSITRLTLKGMTRFFRRLESIGEFGKEGIKIPLSLNLMAICKTNKNNDLCI